MAPSKASPAWDLLWRTGEAVTNQMTSLRWPFHSLTSGSDALLRLSPSRIRLRVLRATEGTLQSPEQPSWGRGPGVSFLESTPFLSFPRMQSPFPPLALNAKALGFDGRGDTTVARTKATHVRGVGSSHPHQRANLGSCDVKACPHGSALRWSCQSMTICTEFTWKLGRLGRHKLWSSTPPAGAVAAMAAVAATSAVAAMSAVAAGRIGRAPCVAASLLAPITCSCFLSGGFI